MSSRLFSFASRYVDEGISVVPLSGKVPLAAWKRYQKELPSIETLRIWFELGTQHPTGIGCICGAISDGLWVLDFDRADWRTAYDEFVDTWLPAPTRTSITGSGRRHVWLRSKKTVKKQKIATSIEGWELQIDVQGEGALVAAPPSLHPNGNEYRFDDTAPIVEIEDPDVVIEWLRERFERHPLPRRTRKFLAEGAPLGQQNEEAYFAAQQLHHARFPKDEAFEKIAYALSICEIDPSQPWTEQDIHKIVDNAYREDLGKPIDAVEDLPEWNDRGNSEVFARLFADTARYCVATNTWYRWNGRYWEEDDGENIRDCSDAVMTWLRERIEDIHEPKLQAKFASWVTQCGNRARYVGLQEMATYRQNLWVREDELDAHPFLLCTSNGVLSLMSGTLGPFNPDLKLTRYVNIPYHPDATCPRWELFLQEVFEPHPEIIPFIQRAIGYTMTGETREHRVFFLIGAGANGKSTMLNVMRRLLGGKMLCRKIDFRTFDPNASDGQRSILTSLQRTRLLLTTEPPRGQKIDAGLLKELCGGEVISARRLYSSTTTEFLPEFKLWIGTNNDPVFDEAGPAIKRRVTLIPFDVSFEGREDFALLDSLYDEIEGIFAWAVRGTQMWLEQGLGTLEILRETQVEMFSRTIPIHGFVNECCEFSDETPTFAEIYQAYRLFCGDNSLETLTKTGFSIELRKLFPQIEAVIILGRAHLRGISLKETEES